LEDNMSDEIQQKASDEIPQEAVAAVKPTEELSPEALSDVNGGVTKGEHIKSGQIQVR
jgi:hypothetical protein